MNGLQSLSKRGVICTCVSRKKAQKSIFITKCGSFPQLLTLQILEELSQEIQFYQGIAIQLHNWTEEPLMTHAIPILQAYLQEIAHLKGN